MTATTAARTPLAGVALPAEGEHRVVINGVPWQTYSAIRELLDQPGLRMTYIEGTLELMTPSPLHELRKKTIARLLEVFALERDVPLVGYGQTTFRREAKQRGLEPDECYVLGGELRDAPDIALEVVVTSGGIGKLPVYAGLGVREVWFFEDDAFRLYQLVREEYQAIDRSVLIPALDFTVLTRFASRADQHEAVREYRELLRAG
ncbi:MAG TPA: Uma2 family endonuclease [Kofleriaceae bacterium]|nr:Uma2 family endonuclease [Kofleriaceae bacterium]